MGNKLNCVCVTTNQKSEKCKKMDQYCDSILYGSKSSTDIMSDKDSDSKSDDRFLEKLVSDYVTGLGPRPSNHPDKTHKLNIKLWNRDFELWKDGLGEKPGPHPIATHKYNTHHEFFADIA